MKLVTKKMTCLIIPVILSILPTLLNAQPLFDDEVSDVPVDGGLSLLVAGGIGYGATKLKNRKKS